MLTKIILYGMASIVLVVVTTRLITAVHARPRIHSLSEVAPSPVAVIFGAGLWRDGSPTPVLQDRVKTATELYFRGKVSKLLMSGDNRVVNYNEPEAMRRYALELGVPDDDIVLDFAGRRTYDTCYRAREIFGLGEVILVTQEFHLPRALYTCTSLGVTAQGVPADQRQYWRKSLLYWHTREVFATAVAFWEVHISRPLPVLGTPEPIYFPKQFDRQDGVEL